MGKKALNKGAKAKAAPKTTAVSEDDIMKEIVGYFENLTVEEQAELNAKKEAKAKIEQEKVAKRQREAQREEMERKQEDIEFKKQLKKWQKTDGISSDKRGGYYCELCSREINCASALYQHIESVKHQGHVQFTQDASFKQDLENWKKTDKIRENGDGSYTCGLCNRPNILNATALYQHIESNAHQKAMGYKPAVAAKPQAAAPKPAAQASYDYSSYSGQDWSGEYDPIYWDDDAYTWACELCPHVKLHADSAIEMHLVSNGHLKEMHKYSGWQKEAVRKYPMLQHLDDGGLDCKWCSPAKLYAESAVYAHIESNKHKKNAAWYKTQK